MEIFSTIAEYSAYAAGTTAAVAGTAKAAGIGTFMAAGKTAILNLGGLSAAVAGKGFVAGSTLAASALIAAPVIIAGTATVAVVSAGIYLATN